MNNRFTNQCPPGQFKCSDGTCIPLGQSCDRSNLPHEGRGGIQVNNQHHSNRHRSVIQKEITRRFGITIDNTTMDEAYSLVQSRPLSAVDIAHLEEIYYSSDDMNLIATDATNYLNINQKSCGNQGNQGGGGNVIQCSPLVTFLVLILCAVLLYIFL